MSEPKFLHKSKYCESVPTYFCCINKSVHVVTLGLNQKQQYLSDSFGKQSESDLDDPFSWCFVLEYQLINVHDIRGSEAGALNFRALNLGD